MNLITGMILGVGWLVVGVISIARGAHWSVILLDMLAGAVFLGLTLRKLLREVRAQAMEDAKEEIQKKHKK